MLQLKRGFWDIFLASVSLYILVLYAPFAIAAHLAPLLDVPIQFVVAVTFISMAISTALSARATGTGLVVAPGVGMALFVSQTVQSGTPIGQLLLAAIIAGGVSIIFCIKSKDPKRPHISYRQKFLDGIPLPVKIGVRGGIGALLASVALDNLLNFRNYSTSPDIFRILVFIFIFGVIAILLSDQIQVWLQEKQDAIHTLFRDVMLLCVRIFQISLPFIILLLLYKLSLFELSQSNTVSTSDSIKYLAHVPSIIFDIFSGNNSFEAKVGPSVIFACIMLFIFIIDIAGSPYDLLRELSDERHMKKTIDNSFNVISIWSAITPFFGLFSSVYYAENNIVTRHDDLRNRSLGISHSAVTASITGFFCAFLFLITGILLLSYGIIFITPTPEIWLKFAVSPTIFCLGIHLTAKSMRGDFERKQDIIQSDQPGHSEQRMIEFFIPVSLTVLLTHFIGVQYSFPFGMCYYYISKRQFRNIYFISAAIILFLLAMRQSDFLYRF